MSSYLLLPMFQIVGHFRIYRYITFAMHLDIHYVWIYNKNTLSKFTKTTYNSELREYYVTL